MTPLSPDTDASLKSYFELLSLWNTKMNLTSIEGFDAFLEKQVGDVIPLLPYIEEAQRLLDLGTGPGIPGILLKIMRPDLDVVLIDATRKKTSFCNEAIRKLGLHDIQALQGRAEDTALQKKLSLFDIVISRATWKLSDYLPIAGRYLSRSGICIAMKGPSWKKELADCSHESALSLCGAHPYALASGEGRTLLIFSWWT